MMSEAKEMNVTEAKPAKGKRPRWYVVQSQSNYEKRVQSAIKEQALMTGLDKFVEEVLFLYPNLNFQF